MRQQLLDAFHRRHACHQFHAGRDLPCADLDFILEAGRLSPSSFGLEQWKFLVLTQPEVKRQLQAACFDQPQVGSASAVLVILARIADLSPDSDHVRRLLARDYPSEQLESALANYRGFHAATDVRAWSVTQCHIAAANMMTAAAAIGVDSCAIGGFVPARVRVLLGIAPEQYEIALIMPLGYCAQAGGAKHRLPLAELVEYR
jgi:nitroreductase